MTADTAVIIPAKDEVDRIGATVSGAREISGVDLVVVVDDGSIDGTADAAKAAGAVVVTHPRNRGKAAAMESGANAVAAIEASQNRATPRFLLFLDADLEETAQAAAPLIEPVREGEVAMTIAILPPQRQGAGGGHGLVVNLARDGIRNLVGFEATQPLSGQRCLTRQAFEAARPLAFGFGVETGLTVDLLRAGFRVREVSVELHHRVTGTDLAAQLHRARQYRDVALALSLRRVPRSLKEAFGSGKRARARRGG